MARTTLAFVFFLITLTSTAARAQEPGRIGIAMGYPASVGVVWHVSDRFALRPELSLSQVSSTSTSVVTTVLGSSVTSTTTQSSTDQWQLGVGASALVYLQRWDALRTYVSPRFAYTRGTVDGTIGSVNSAGQPATSPTTTTFTQNTYFVSGSFGAQYALGMRFAVFGELGLGWSHNSTESDQAGAGNTDGHTIGTRSGAGVIVYF